MARGGRRDGKPGSAYANRTDLQQVPTAAPGQQYGKAQAQVQAQRQIPLPSTPPPGAAPAAAPPMAPPPMMEPGQVPFDRPTERPNEPITAGLPSGAGPGPEALNMPPAPDAVAAQLRALYAIAPNDDLAHLIMLREQGF